MTSFNLISGLSMKKLLSYALMTVFVTSLLILNGCNEDGSNPVAPPPPINKVTYTSSNGGIFKYDNVSIIVLPGTVPFQSNGSPGSVTFSIVTSNTLEAGIAALPGEYMLVGKYINIVPGAFVFRYPVNCEFPAGSASNSSGLAIARYYPELFTWKLIMPSTVDSINKKLGIGSLSLGYFAVVRYVLAGDKSPESCGGMQYGPEFDKWYSITIATDTLKYSSQLVWYANDSPERATFVSGSDAANRTPVYPCKGIIAQGKYTVWVSMAYLVGNVFKTYTYSSKSDTVNIDHPLTWNSWGTSTGYIDIVLPAYGTWDEGYPPNWPAPSTYSSGLFRR
jgi:hypothetical protein